ncbi:MAG: hypothetical protein MHPSP_002819, partial [Paramarteilia canceri]
NSLSLILPMVEASETVNESRAQSSEFEQILDRLLQRGHVKNHRSILVALNAAETIPHIFSLLNKERPRLSALWLYDNNSSSAEYY